MGGERFRLSGSLCIVLALMLLLVPIQWIFAAVLAAIMHEAGHFLAIWLCTGRTPSIRLLSGSARMALPPMSRGREVLCALAGPLFGLSLLLIARWMPRVAVCAGMQSAYNLLPIHPLDGGRALQSGLAILLPPPVAGRICRAIEILCKLAIALLAIYGSLWLKLGIFPLLMATLLLIRVK